MNHQSVLLVLGTRPEAIKLAPLPAALRAAGVGNVQICSTGQHREMLRPILQLFDLALDHDLDLMEPRQTLSDLTARCLTGLSQVLADVRPSLVVVQGDTTTALAASLAAFYLQVPVAHVEAGLRTGRRDSPFPEEINRVLVTRLADYHFAPTESAQQNLLSEGVPASRIWLTGNTVVDALHGVLARVGELACPPGMSQEFAARVAAWASMGRRLVLVTGHRRENFGQGVQNIAAVLRELADRNDDIEIVYSVHPNPSVREPVTALLGSQDRVHLVDPLPYSAFAWLMRRAYLILTDSGGIQEEAPGLGKPVLVMRDTTERPEAVDAGTARLVGTSRDRIRDETETLLRNPSAYQQMAHAVNPFGDGRAAERIAAIIASLDRAR